MIKVKLPLSSNYNLNKNQKNFNLEIAYDDELSLVYLSKKIPKKIMLNRFIKTELIEAEDHLDNIINFIIKKKIINKKSKIEGFCYKDLTFLNRLKKEGFKNTSLLYNLNNKNINRYLEKFSNINQKNKVDVLIMRHVIEHSYNLKLNLNKIRDYVTDNGIIIFEIPDNEKIIKEGDCTFIWEDHTYYFSEKSFSNILYKNGFQILFTKRYKYNFEDCLIFIVKNFKNMKKIYKQKNLIFSFEKIHNLRKKKIAHFLEFHKKLNFKFILYGTGHLSITFIAMMKIEKYITLALDIDKKKFGKYIPGTNIKIKNVSNRINNENLIYFLGMNPLRIKQSLKKIKLTKKTKYYSIFKGNEFSIDNFL